MGERVHPAGSIAWVTDPARVSVNGLNCRDALGKRGEGVYVAGCA